MWIPIQLVPVILVIAAIAWLVQRVSALKDRARVQEQNEVLRQARGDASRPDDW
jgi:hypothetical protein